MDISLYLKRESGIAIIVIDTRVRTRVHVYMVRTLITPLTTKVRVHVYYAHVYQRTREATGIAIRVSKTRVLVRL